MDNTKAPTLTNEQVLQKLVEGIIAELKDPEGPASVIDEINTRVAAGEEQWAACRETMLPVFDGMMKYVESEYFRQRMHTILQTAFGKDVTVIDIVTPPSP